GPGRRVNAHELEHAPVESVVFTVTVAPTGEVTVSPDGPPSVLEGRTLSDPTPWSGEVLMAGNRAFGLAPPARPMPRDRPGIAPTPPAPVGPHRTVLFNRPPR